jgi:hypothetical protein
MIWHHPTDSYWKELIFSGWCGGYPTWDIRIICGASAICLDLPSVGNFWIDWEDPGGACLSPSYTSNKGFSKSHLLLIIGLQWPMTLTPTNEAISHESRGKKTLTVKAKKWPACWDGKAEGNVMGARWINNSVDSGVRVICSILINWWPCY